MLIFSSIRAFANECEYIDARSTHGRYADWFLERYSKPFSDAVASPDFDVDKPKLSMNFSKIPVPPEIF